MILVIDVGNTNLVFGVYKEKTLIGSWRLSTTISRTSDEMGMQIKQMLETKNITREDISDVFISSVVPPIMHSLELAISKYFGRKAVIINANTKTGINICTDNPKEVGADNIINSVAAVALYGAPVIVIDFGTATTVTVVDENKNYLGGAICAGIKISMEALYTHAAKLPRVEIARPEKVIGSNTIDAMQSGAIYGYAGQINYIVKAMHKELGYKTKVVATGGLASLIAGETDCIDIVDKNLTLEGLRLIYELNKEI